MVTSLARIMDTLPCKTIADFTICGVPTDLALTRMHRYELYDSGPR
jgi:hypothetical protein